MSEEFDRPESLEEGPASSPASDPVPAISEEEGLDVAYDLPPEPPPAPKASAPVEESERFETLDVIRGVAVFGILFVNIGAFALVRPARYQPEISGGVDSLNHLVWLITHTLADTKFMPIFTMLFGAGIALMSDRRRAGRQRGVAAYYRRALFLLFAGAVHGLFIWDGDVLYFYAFWSLLLYLAPRIPTPILALSGLTLLGIHVYRFAFVFGSDGDGIRYNEIEIFRGDWTAQFQYRVGEFIDNATHFTIVLGPYILGLILCGMTLYRLRFLTGQRSKYVYFLVALFTAPPGFYLIDLSRSFHPFDEYRMTIVTFVSGSLLLSLTWISVIVLVARLAPKAPLIRSLAAVGRMAFTNYIAHSLICTYLFYGFGMGLFGYVDRVGQLFIVLGICAVQLLASPLWLRFFRFGPLEWIWRSVTYWRWQPLRRRPPEPIEKADQSGPPSALDEQAPGLTLPGE